MIITDQKILRAKNEEVGLEEANILIQSLEKELNYSALMGRPGIGLACPQIGINKKVAIVRVGGSNNISLNLVNAKIKNGYSPFLFKEEGCLSFNGKLNDTMRYQEIHIIDNLVMPHSFIATGLVSVAIQHELDHLDGILFFDRVVAKNHLKVKIRPNDLCICGKPDILTGKMKKFKRCCGATNKN